MSARSYLLLFLTLLIMPGLASLPLSAFSRCGLILAHDHILLGGANEADLRGHLQGEASCASGKSAVSNQNNSRTSTSKEVVSVIRIELISVPTIIGVGYQLLAQTTVIVPEYSNPLRPRSIGQTLTRVYSLITPPFDPPPRSA